jgi:hypothetical protein
MEPRRLPRRRRCSPYLRVLRGVGEARRASGGGGQVGWIRRTCVCSTADAAARAATEPWRRAASEADRGDAACVASVMRAAAVDAHRVGGAVHTGAARATRISPSPNFCNARLLWHRHELSEVTRVSSKEGVN